MLNKVLLVILLLMVTIGVVGQVRKSLADRPLAPAADSIRDLTLDSPRSTRSAGDLSAPLPLLDSVARITIRDQLRTELDRHYLDSLLVGSDSIVRHWPAELEPVPYAIIPGGPASYSSEMAFEARGAVDAWGSTVAGVRLIETSDTMAALLTLRWVDTLGGERGGYTDVTWDRSGRIRRAQIYLATHATTSNRELSGESRREIALHEIGHALGLPHSNRPTDVMYPIAQNAVPSERDRFSLRMLYQLPTGWVGVGPRNP
jgi:hypothetical protein